METRWNSSRFLAVRRLRHHQVGRSGLAPPLPSDISLITELLHSSLFHSLYYAQAILSTKIYHLYPLAERVSFVSLTATSTNLCSYLNRLFSHIRNGVCCMALVRTHPCPMRVLFWREKPTIIYSTLLSHTPLYMTCGSFCSFAKTLLRTGRSVCRCTTLP